MRDETQLMDLARYSVAMREKLLVANMELNKLTEFLNQRHIVLKEGETSVDAAIRVIKNRGTKCS